MHFFPTLHTERLTLRKLEVEDFPSLIKYVDNKKISDRIINIPHPYREPDAVFRLGYIVQGFKKKTRFVFAIILKEQNELIGEISLHVDSNTLAQLGYWIAEPFWNKGIATEAIQSILKFGFERLNLETVYATAHIDNEGSKKVLLKNGLEHGKIQGNIIQFTIINNAEK